MPVMKCTKDGQPGHKWGEAGVCFVGPDSESKAAAVGRAIHADSVQEYRQDIGGSITAKLDANGFLRVDGVAAKAGVLTYLLPDGTIRRELVPEDTLFSADSIATLQGAPVTIEHPGVLNPANAAEHARGSVPSVRPDGDQLYVSMVVTAQDAIAAIESGKRQLSPGYTVSLDMTPGEWRGQKYDAVQRNRVYNHLAIVSTARGGSDCRINLDGLNCAVEIQPTHTDEVTKMPTVKLASGLTVEVADASTAGVLQNEINALSARADAADKMVEKAKYDELQGKHDALAAELEVLKKSEKMDADQIGQFVETVEAARKLKADVVVKADGKWLGATEIMAAALGIDAAGKSAEYVKGRFDAAIELSAAGNIQQQRDATKTDADDSAPVLTGLAKFKQEQLARGA